MTKSPFVLQEEGSHKKEESYAFIDTKADSIDNMPRNVETKNVDGTSYIDTSKKLYEKRGSIYPLCGILMATVLLIWLIGLTMVREFQFAELRREIDTLCADFEAVKQRVMNDQLMDELKDFEEEVNAENDKKTERGMDLQDDLGDELDDEDFVSSGSFENYESENGRFYDDNIDDRDEDVDYADVLGEVMEAKLQDKSQFIVGDDHPPITKIMRISQQEQVQNARTKRTLIGETSDGVPVLEESYLEARAKNLSGTYHQQAADEKHRKLHKKYYHTPTSTTVSPSQIYSRPSRVMQTDVNNARSFQRVVRIRKPQIRSGLAADYDAAFLERKPEEIGTRRIRRRRKQKQSHGALEMNEEVELLSPAAKPTAKPNHVLVAQFHGDTSEHNKGDNYDGNGRLLHPIEVPYTAWSPARWLPHMGMDTHFPLQNGAVSVPETGIYFIYAQVYFHDAHDTNGFKVYRNDGQFDESILHCTTMTHSTEKMDKTNTCFTAGAFHLTKSDTIFIKNLGSMRYSLMQPGKSFFGLIKLSDAFGR